MISEKVAKASNRVMMIPSRSMTKVHSLLSRFHSHTACAMSALLGSP